MVREDIREHLAYVAPNVVVFDNPSFDNSIIGTDGDNERVIYSYESMVEEMSKEANISEEEAAEFIEYNTIRTIPYINGNAPVISYNLNI